ncbi:MAG: branched-chain amino acid aminotransferase [Eubacteriales bacterium]|nr:branched-chain amino acid aminotransferase [Eubacteriales bacterium]
MKQEFTVLKTTNPKMKPDPDTLQFGTVFTDHMFIMDYSKEKGWYDGRIVPYGPIPLDPAAAVFHYAQEFFEGLKAYKTKDDRVLLFRPEMNEKRANLTAERLCIPPMPPGLMVKAIKALVSVERDWIPGKEGTSLYIRPFVIATEPFLGVREAHRYMFIIILSPVGPYYKEGLFPTKIFVENEYVRAVPGGTGNVKIGGNYAAALKSQEKAQGNGYSQVLWLDGVERKYVEEIGTSNAFFIIDGEIVTAPLSGTILPGITRDSVITLLKSWGEKVAEKRITIQEIYEAHAAGKLDEVFASGTAAVISPVGELCWQGKKIIVNNGEIGRISQKLYDELTAIQIGKREDPFDWTTEV